MLSYHVMHVEMKDGVGIRAPYCLFDTFFLQGGQMFGCRLSSKNLTLNIDSVATLKQMSTL